MELQEGIVIELENGEAYLISNHFMYDGIEYVAMVAINEPVHVKFAEVIESEDESQISVEPVEDEERINFFKQYIVNDFFADAESDEDEETGEEYAEDEHADGDYTGEHAEGEYAEGDDGYYDDGMGEA